MSRLEDLVTQVKNPSADDESESQPQNATQRDDESSASAGAAPSATRSASCSLFCCAAGGDKKAKPPPPGASPITQVAPPRKGSVAKRPLGLSISGKPAPPAADDEPSRDLINSPRSGGGPRATAPWRDDALLPPLSPRKKHMKCLVLDLDETLVHSSFKPVDRCDFVVPVEIEGRVHQVYVAKRPYVDEFMKRMGDLFEVVVFTASLSKYADPVLDLLDIHKVIDHRLFRESCSCFKGSYVKDMGRMGRDLKRIMILDNSPHSYAFNPENAIPCESWFNDYEDTELKELIPIFEQLADESVTDVMEMLEKMKISPVAANIDDEPDDGDDGDDESDSYSDSDGERQDEETQTDDS